MLNVEEDREFQCPYCMSELSIRLDATAGKIQDFTNDCETCCQPIAIHVEWGSDFIEQFSAEQES